jgi:hypothetical protein
MSMEFQSDTAPVDAPIDAPAPSEPSQPDVSSDPMEREMAATFDKIHQPRGEDGKWARPPEWKPEAGPSEIPADDSETGEQHSDIAPPVSLNAKAREHWASLPTEMKQFIAEREVQSQQKISELGQHARTARELGQVFEQFHETAPKLADGRPAPPTQVMHHLLAANDALERNPSEAIQWLANHYGVDLGSLGQAPPDPQQEAQTLIQQAQQHALQRYQQEQQRQQQWQWQQQAQQLTQHVERFASDKPHWAELEPEILHHVSGLRATRPEMDSRDVLQAAYDKALAANPQYDVAKKSEIKKRADEAKRIASMNVKSVGGFIARAGGNWADDLGKIYDSIQSRGR